MSVSIDRYLQIRSARIVGILPSGAIGYLTEITGIPQLWQIDTDGIHEQVTFGTERVTFAAPSPTAEQWLIARDTGGNEREQLFLIEPAGGEHALTHEPTVLHRPGAFSPDGANFAFTHTSRNGIDFDVAIVRMDGSDRRELVQLGGWCSVVDWSPHGILLAQASTPFDHNLFLVDPVTGTFQHLTPHTGQVQYASPTLLNDGRVVCACDANSEFARLAFIRSDEPPEFLTPDEADVEMITTDYTRTQQAWTINRDGYSELWLADRRIESLPSGVYSRPVFAPDGRLFITVASPDDSADVWAIEPTARKTRSAVGGLRRDSFVRPALEYVQVTDGRHVPYFLFGQRGRPTVLHVHGGPEAQFRPQLMPVLQYLCAQGYTVAAPNIRGSTGYGRTYHHLDDVEKRFDAVDDLACLARALGADSGIPVAIVGGSYGGYMTMAAITEHPELYQAAVNTVGIVNLVSFLERTAAYRRAMREAEYGSLEHHRELLERLSPIHKVDRIRTPLIVIHGANDPRVPVHEAEQIVAALKERGAIVEYVCYPDEGHGIVRLANRLDCYARVAAFLHKHLPLSSL